MRHHRLLLAVDVERQRRDPRAGGEARPAHEDGGAAADREVGRERRVQAYVEVGQSAVERSRAGAAGSLRAIAASELDDIRREYEQSLSWRVTRPLRALGRRVRAVRGGQVAAPPRGAGGHDTWLEHYHDDVLAPIDAACAAGGPDRFALFSELDIDLWALLLTKDYSAYPNIHALLPTVPHPTLQERWNGTSGVPLANQSAAFYRRLRDRYAEVGERPLADSRVLDFGCGWGRLTRFLARDVPLSRLYGCDPVESILAVCRDSGVPATLARSELVPDRLPFDELFDLAFAFSVFTHSPSRRTSAAWRRCTPGCGPARSSWSRSGRRTTCPSVEGSTSLATSSPRTRPTRPTRSTRAVR